MLRLTGYELGKILKRKIVFAAFALLAVLGGMLYLGDGPQSVISRLPDGTYIGGAEAIAYDKGIAEKYEGVLTEEKVQDILKTYAPGAPDGGFWTINSIYNAIQDSFGNIDGSYNGLTVEEAFPDYRGEEPLWLGYTDGYAGFIMMGCYMMMTLGFVLIIALSPVFSDEYAKRTDALILTARYGKNRCGWAKILAAFLFALLAAAACVLVMLLLFLEGFGFTGGESSIQINHWDLLKGVPYFMSCLEAAGSCILLWLAGTLLLTAGTLILSALLRTPFLTLTAALVLYVLPALGSLVHIPREVLALTPFWCFLSEWTLTFPKLLDGKLSYIWLPALLAAVLIPFVFWAGQRIFARHQAF